ncbi:hypothetical protein BDB01DRAFT_809122 [Pilobolus umbonatus]|nr:hypothetical protein BDB01DRAFT_809122 [Pilobolus umbonatus]
MRGSLRSLFQNSALMSLLISLSLAVTVWLPYLIGVIFIMTDSLDFIRIPLKLVRLMTDPLIDILFYIFIDLVWPNITECYSTYKQSLMYFIPTASIPIQLHHSLQYVNHLFITCIEPFVSDKNTSVPVISRMKESPWFSVDDSVSYLSKFIDQTEPFIESTFRRYQLLAVNQATMDRLACIILGYVIVALACSYYLTRMNRVYAAFGHSAKEIIQQQTMILKVCFFMVIELMISPVICGVLLDYLTLPLFESVTVSSRWEYTLENPVSSFFLHWLCGTVNMFFFTLLITAFRNIVRNGAVWFIRNPDNPQFHPIREIIDTPAKTQYRKIGSSLLLYFSIIAVTVGGIIQIIKLSTHSVLPLRWNLSNPLSTVPIDMILLQILISIAIKHYQPVQVSKNLLDYSIKQICSTFRLTSYFFGVRKPEEEGRFVYHTWSAWFNRHKHRHYSPTNIALSIYGDEASFIWEGQLLMVPKHDNVPYGQNHRMLIPVDPFTFTPLNQIDKELGHPANNGLDGSVNNTIIIYSPPHFHLRLYIMGITLWSTINFFLTAAIFVPILLGRWAAEHWLHWNNEVHDLYSYFIGAAILLVLSSVINKCTTLMRDLYTPPTGKSRKEVLLALLHHGSVIAFRWIVFITCFLVLVPSCLGILLDLYIVLPFKKLDNVSISLYPLFTWSYGFICMTFIHKVVQWLPFDTLKNDINNITSRDISTLNLDRSIRRIVKPVLITSLIASVVPFLFAYICIRGLVPTNTHMQIKMIQYIYPCSLLGFGISQLTRVGSKVGKYWTDSIRDDNYLIGRALHNLEH